MDTIEDESAMVPILVPANKVTEVFKSIGEACLMGTDSEKSKIKQKYDIASVNGSGNTESYDHSDLGHKSTESAKHGKKRIRQTLKKNISVCDDSEDDFFQPKAKRSKWNLILDELSDSDSSQTSVTKSVKPRKAKDKAKAKWYMYQELLNYEDDIQTQSVQNTDDTINKRFDNPEKSDTRVGKYEIDPDFIPNINKAELEDSDTQTDNSLLSSVSTASSNSTDGHMPTLELMTPVTFHDSKSKTNPMYPVKDCYVKLIRLKFVESKLFSKTLPATNTVEKKEIVKKRKPKRPHWAIVPFDTTKIINSTVDECNIMFNRTRSKKTNVTYTDSDLLDYIIQESSPEVISDSPSSYQEHTKDGETSESVTSTAAVTVVSTVIVSSSLTTTDTPSLTTLSSIDNLPVLADPPDNSQTWLISNVRTLQKDSEELSINHMASSNKSRFDCLTQAKPTCVTTLQPIIFSTNKPLTTGVTASVKQATIPPLHLKTEMVTKSERKQAVSEEPLTDKEVMAKSYQQFKKERKPPTPSLFPDIPLVKEVLPEKPQQMVPPTFVNPSVTSALSSYQGVKVDSHRSVNIYAPSGYNNDSKALIEQTPVSSNNFFSIPQAALDNTLYNETGSKLGYTTQLSSTPLMRLLEQPNQVRKSSWNLPSESLNNQHTTMVTYVNDYNNSSTCKNSAQYYSSQQKSGNSGAVSTTMTPSHHQYNTNLANNQPYMLTNPQNINVNNRLNTQNTLYNTNPVNNRSYMPINANISYQQPDPANPVVTNVVTAYIQNDNKNTDVNGRSNIQSVINNNQSVNMKPYLLTNEMIVAYQPNQANSVATNVANAYIQNDNKNADVNGRSNIQTVINNSQSVNKRSYLLTNEMVPQQSDPAKPMATNVANPYIQNIKNNDVNGRSNIQNVLNNSPPLNKKSYLLTNETILPQQSDPSNIMARHHLYQPPLQPDAQKTVEHSYYNSGSYSRFNILANVQNQSQMPTNLAIQQSYQGSSGHQYHSITPHPNSYLALNNSTATSAMDKNKPQPPKQFYKIAPRIPTVPQVNNFNPPVSQSASITDTSYYPTSSIRFQQNTSTGMYSPLYENNYKKYTKNNEKTLLID